MDVNIRKELYNFRSSVRRVMERGDIDVAYVDGFGFPADCGGPIF